MLSSASSVIVVMMVLAPAVIFVVLITLGEEAEAAEVKHMLDCHNHCATPMLLLLVEAGEIENQVAVFANPALTVIAAFPPILRKGSDPRKQSITTNL